MRLQQPDNPAGQTQMADLTCAVWIDNTIRTSYFVCFFIDGKTDAPMQI